MAIAVTVERTTGQGGTVAAPIAKQVLEAMLGRGMRGAEVTEVADEHAGRRPLPDHAAASAPAAWPTSTWPRTPTSAARSR